MSEIRLAATKLTVEYDAPGGEHAIMLVRFPEGDERVLIVGTLPDLRDVVYGMSKLLYDLEESEGSG